MVRVNVEAVIRKQRTQDAEDLLEVMVKDLHERRSIIESEATVPANLAKLVETVVWAAPRTEMPTLLVVREQLLLRYGEAQVVRTGPERRVSADIEAGLTREPAPEAAILWECESIAAEHRVAFDRRDMAPLLDPALGRELVKPIPAASTPAPPAPAVAAAAAAAPPPAPTAATAAAVATAPVATPVAAAGPGLIESACR